MTTLKFLSTPSARRATVELLEQCASLKLFLSTPSARRATPEPHAQGVRNKISIHALREEGDRRYQAPKWPSNYFYPRPPRGGRRYLANIVPYSNSNFYPRPPRGGRRSDMLENFLPKVFLSTPSARRATAKTERKPSAFVSLYTSLHKLQRGACKTNRKITPLLAQTAGIPVRSVRENHVRCLFALAGHQKISTLSCANSGCSPTCSTLVW